MNIERINVHRDGKSRRSARFCQSSQCTCGTCRKNTNDEPGCRLRSFNGREIPDIRMSKTEATGEPLRLTTIYGIRVFTTKLRELVNRSGPLAGL